MKIDFNLKIGIFNMEQKKEKFVFDKDKLIRYCIPSDLSSTGIIQNINNSLILKKQII